MVSYFYLPQPNFSRQHADHNLVALRDEQQLQSVNADDYLCLFSSYSNTILNTGTNKCMRMISSTSIGFIVYRFKPRKNTRFLRASHNSTILSTIPRTSAIVVKIIYHERFEKRFARFFIEFMSMDNTQERHYDWIILFLDHDTVCYIRL